MATSFLILSMVSMGISLWPFIAAGEAGDEDEGTWEIEGSHQATMLEGMSSDKVAKEFFDVSPNAVAIMVDLHWTSNYPEAFSISIIDGVGILRWQEQPGTKEGNMMTTIKVEGVPGTWYLSVSRTLCGCPPEARLSFSANLDTVSRPIPGPGTVKSSSDDGNGDGDNDVEGGLSIEFGKPRSGDIARYEYSFGDGSTSGWTDAPFVGKTYEEPGTYGVKARVIYSDGMASSWGSSTTVRVGNEVDQEDGGLGTNEGAAQALEMVLLVLCAMVAFAVRGTVSGKP